MYILYVIRKLALPLSALASLFSLRFCSAQKSGRFFPKDNLYSKPLKLYAKNRTSLPNIIRCLNLFAYQIFQLCLLASIPFIAFGDEGEPTLEEKQAILMAPNPDISNPSNTVYLLQGLTLVNGEQQLDAISQEAGIQIHLDNRDYQPLIFTLQEHLNHPLTRELIAQVKEEVVQYYYKEFEKYVAVLVPVQDITDGIVVLEVLPGVVGKIQFVGQKWFSESSLDRHLDLKNGDPIIEGELLDYMSWINRNPFRKMQMILQPGVEKGTCDIDFVTKDQFPTRFFIGSDNTGYLSTNQYRLFGGMNWGNAFKQGDLLYYQYTAAPNFSQFQSHVVSYTAFLPWKNVLTLFGCYANVFPTISDFTASGKYIQLSSRYSVPFLPLYGEFLDYLDVGFDWKFITSNLFFVGDIEQSVPTTNDIINVTQFLRTYGLQKNWGFNQVLMFNANLYASIWKSLLPHQRSSDYENLRPGSHVRYAYLRTSLNHRYQFKNKCVFISFFRGQLASGTLPTSEQFGLGGADTVRGYYEQQFVADNALLFNFELYSPPLSLFKGVSNTLTFLAFFDYAYGRNYSYPEPSFRAQNLFGLGPGIRYDIVPYLNIKMDYGFQLKGIPQDHRTGRFHFSLNLSN